MFYNNWSIFYILLLLLILLLYVFWVFDGITYRKLQKETKFETLPAGENLQIWQSNKKNI